MSKLRKASDVKPRPPSPAEERRRRQARVEAAQRRAEQQKGDRESNLVRSVESIGKTKKPDPKRPSRRASF